jgi:hypothetical protein
MPTLPNIFPATNNDSFRDDEMSKLSAVPHKGTESFDHLMTRALSPSAPKTNASKVPDADGAAAKNIFDGAGKANGAQASATLNVGSVIKNSAEVEPNIKTAVGNFPVQPKNSKTSPQALETGRTKKCSDQSGAGVNSAAPISVNGATANPEIVAAQISPPATALEPAKAAVDISMTEAAIVVPGNIAGISTSLSAAKNFSPTPVKNASANVPPIQPDTAVISKSKPDGPEKIPAANGIQTVARTNTTDSKFSSLMPLAQTVSPLADDGAEHPKAPILAAKTASDLTTSETSSLPAADVKISTPTPAVDDGTPAAKQIALMNNGEKANKTADTAGKFLPGSVAVTAGGNDFSPRMNQNDAAIAVSSSTQNGSTTSTQSVAEPVGNSSADDLRLQTLERTHDLVALHALRLSDVGNNSLQVVIKPGAGTQLSLELRQRDDGVEAQATLQQGDFTHLNQRWPELQQQLEQRGIKLAALTGENNFDGGGSGFFQSKQNAAAEMDSFSAGTLVVPVITNELAARASAHRGWETWA